MYTYDSAVCLKDRQWLECDISGIPLIDLYEIYKEIRVRVTHVAMDGVEEFKLNDQSLVTQTYPGSIELWLVDQGESSLPTYSEITDINNRLNVEYRNIYLAGYKCDFTEYNFGTMDVPRDVCNDILISRDDTDYEALLRNTVFTIGGYVHKPILTDDGVVLPNGLRTMDTLVKDSFGLFNLGVLGDIHYLPINDDTLGETTPIVNNFKDQVFVKVDNTGLDLLNCDLFLVLAGVFHNVGRVTALSGELLSIDLTNYPLVYRYLQSREALDFTSVDEAISEEDNLVLARLFSNDGMRALLNHDSSFVIAIENNDGEPLCYEETKHSHTGIRGYYKVEDIPTGLLYNDSGLVMDYVTIPNDMSYTVSTREDITPNWVMSPRDQSNGMLTISDQKDFKKPYDFSDAVELNLYRLTKEDIEHIG